jgi:hypothetical protein
MLKVDPEPFESLTAPREIEGRLFLPCSSERGLSAVEGSIITPFTAEGLLMYKR